MTWLIRLYSLGRLREKADGLGMYPQHFVQLSSQIRICTALLVQERTAGQITLDIQGCMKES